MAALTTIVCQVCHQPKTVAVSNGLLAPSVCPACEAEKRLVQRTEHLDALKTQTLEDRLARVEAWMYDHAHVQHGYIEPPTF